MTVNKLLQAGIDAQARFDLVGPTVDDDIRRVINRYGAAAVGEAVKRATKAKRGRKAEKDWPALHPILVEDARKVLEGGDPFSERTNYSIAQVFVQNNPGHSPAATQRRIMKKLSQMRMRWTLINAEIIGESEYPHGAYLNVLERLVSLLPDWDIWKDRMSRAKGAIDDYTAKHGPPAVYLSIKDIEEGAQDLVLGALLGKSPPTLSGLFGLGGR